MILRLTSVFLQQTALFVIPFMSLLGWVLDKPLALLFDPFESVVLYISGALLLVLYMTQRIPNACRTIVHTMGYVVADGRSNWLEGVILVCLYVIIAVTFWFYPGTYPPFSSFLLAGRGRVADICAPNRFRILQQPRGLLHISLNTPPRTPYLALSQPTHSFNT